MPLNPHTKILNRLQRAHGHLKSIIAMIEDGRECLDIAQQLQAVETASGNAKKALVHEHIEHCLEHSVRQGPESAQATIQEFKEITKYL